MKRLTQQSQNKLFIVLSISLLMNLSPNITFAQNPSTQIEIDFSKMQGVSAGKETFTLELKDSRLDVSHITERIRSLMSQSEYQNLSFGDSWDFYLRGVKNPIESLCSNLVELIEFINCLRVAYPYSSDSSNTTLLRYPEFQDRLQQNFLYPDNYYPIGTLSSQVIQRANSISCCYDHDIAKTILYGSSAQSNQILNKLKDIGTSCLKQTGHAVIENLQSPEFMDKEFSCHEKISEYTGCKVYFVHPYSSYERGLSENTNGLIRQYFPKKTDFRKITQKDVKRVEVLLNNRPRKSLGFLSPNEFHRQKMVC